MSKPGEPDYLTTMQAVDAQVVGRIYLPGHRYFNAPLAGATEIYRFDAVRDRFLIEAGAAEPVLQTLLETCFRPREWQIRRSGAHARSQAYRR